MKRGKMWGRKAVSYYCEQFGADAIVQVLTLRQLDH